MKSSSFLKMRCAIALVLGAGVLVGCNEPNRMMAGTVNSQLRDLWWKERYADAFDYAVEKSVLGHVFTARYIRDPINRGDIPPERYPEAVEAFNNLGRTTPDAYLNAAGLAQSNPEFAEVAGPPTVWYERAFESGIRVAAFDAALYEADQGNQEAARSWAERGFEAFGERLYAGDPAVVNKVLNLRDKGVVELSLDEHARLVESSQPGLNPPLVEALARRVAEERGAEAAAPYLQRAYDAYGAMKEDGNGWAASQQASLVRAFPDQLGNGGVAPLDLLLEARELGFDMASRYIAQEMQAQELETVGDGLPQEVFWQETVDVMNGLIARDESNWWPYSQLADIYWEGKAGEVDRRLAIQYLEQAVERDRPQLQNRLQNWRRIAGG